MSSLPSQIGPYAITQKIGAGGMGTVFLAHHIDTHQVAAVKVLPASMAREAGFVARFEREIESLKRLTNPHIIQLYESGTDNETYYYAMEYVDGETLADLLKREKRLPWRRVIDIGVQVCSALKSAHDAGIIHRDLKPSNLLLNDDGFVKLTDFGIAQMFASSKLTATGGIVGTAEFMSPEQADGRRASKQSDLYSLGAVLYALVTGRPPFTGNTSSEVIHKHKYGQFERPSLLVPEIPSWLEVIICQLLEKEPDKRFPDAYVLSRQLEQVKKRVELSMRDTITSMPSKGDVGPTVALPAEPDFGGATMMKDLVGQELERLHGDHPIAAFFNRTPVLILLLILVVAGGFYWFRDHEPPPEEQFEAARTVLEGPESDKWLAAGNDMRALADADPDTWREEAAPYLAKVELYRLKNTLGRKARKTQRRGPNSEPERLLLLAQNYREQGDLAAASKVLTSLTTLLGDNAQYTEINQVAKQLLADISAERAEMENTESMVSHALDRADRLREQGDLDGARQIWSSVIELYDNDDALKTYTDRARAGLNADASQAH